MQAETRKRVAAYFEIAKVKPMPRNDNTRTEPRRIQFEFSPDAFARLENMKKETNSGSYAELVRNALRAYEWIIQQEHEGYEIGLVKDNALVKIIKFLF